MEGHDPKECILIDCGDSKPVQEFLEKKKPECRISTVILTHKHWDHTDGVPGFKAYAKEKWEVDLKIYAGKEEGLEFTTDPVSEETKI